MRLKRNTAMMAVYLLLLCGCSKEIARPQNKTSDEPYDQVSMTFTGDLLFEQDLYDYWGDYQFGTYFDQIKPYLDSDIVVGNQEVPIGGEELGISGIAYTFNAPKQIADQLGGVGFDIMTLSNNHSYDMGYQGIVNTLQNLQENGIQTVGMYASQEDAKQIQVIEKNGIKIAFLAYTYDTNEPIDEAHHYVVKTFLNEQRVFDEEHQQMLRQDVLQAQESADVVIVAMHWGNEFTFSINDTQRQAAEFLNELGVNLIIGNHPHTPQTMEYLTHENGNRTIVFYSLGNLVSAAAMVDRASIDFTNMYEIGVILNLDLVKHPKLSKVTIEHMVITPVINQFEHGYTNFRLIPFPEYSEELAKQHYQREFSDSFRYDWLKERIHQLYEGKVDINE